MQVLDIVASSWPLAVMFIALCCTGIALHLMRWIERGNREDKAYRAAQAREIATYSGNER